MKTFLYFCSILLALFFYVFSHALTAIEPKQFIFPKEPIDVIIPCTEKDVETLNFCIEGITSHGFGVRRVIVVSQTKLSDRAEWVAESAFPFSKAEIAFEIFQDQEKARVYQNNSRNRLGWIYQQLLKFYAPLIIDKISSNVLILDADTIFLHPVSFLQENGAGCFNPGGEYHRPYFEHMKRLLPDLHRVYPEYSGISHHMLFQKCLLVDLQAAIESYHHKPMWKALLHCIDHKHLFGSCLSEYEIYFNYALLRSNQFLVRKFKWDNVSSLSCLNQYRAKKYHYVSAHSYCRK